MLFLCRPHSKEGSSSVTTAISRQLQLDTEKLSGALQSCGLRYVSISCCESRKHALILTAAAHAGTGFSTQDLKIGPNWPVRPTLPPE